MGNSSRLTSQRLVQCLMLSRHSRLFSGWLLHKIFYLVFGYKSHLQKRSFLTQDKLDFGALPLKPGPDYCFHSCLYNSLQCWQDSTAHTRVLAFNESPGMWMSGWLDELWPQIPDKHNDSIYSDLAAWMQIDSMGNKFSQAKNFSIQQADPKKKNAPREVQLGCKSLLCFYSTSAYHPANSFGRWLTCTPRGSF